MEIMGKYKDTFVCDRSKSLECLKDYLTNKFGNFQTREALCYGNKTILSVGDDYYERVIVAGRQFLVDQKLSNDIFWLDNEEILEYCENIKVACGMLGKRKMINFPPDLNCPVPHDILEYLNDISQYLKEEVSHRYIANKNALSIQIKNLDYNKQLEKLSNFIANNGYGPFDSINKMSITGEILVENFPVLIKK